MEEPQLEVLPNKSRHRKKLLRASIMQQMEFYFSDSNLSKDRFLSKLLQDDSYVDLSVFLQFNKIRTLTTSSEEICKALKYSEILELNEDKTKVCRKTPIQVKENQDDCTIYVESLPADAEHDWLKDIFSKFGTVDYISIPRYKHNRIIKGFAFIEFDTVESANKALEYFESIGCKLPTKIPPEQLVSITTFNNENELLANKKENVEKEPQNKVSQKEVSFAETVESNDDKLLEKTNDKDKKRSVSESDNDKIETKKLKSDDENDETDKNKVAEESENIEVNENDDDKTNEGSAEESEGKTKKKKRHRKKHHKKQSDSIQQIGLKVLAKREWKQLRNKYLNLQRQKMKNVKEQLNRSRFAAHNFENSEQKNDVSTPRFQYAPGCIVYIRLPEDSNDTKKFTGETRSVPGVQYIDIISGNDKGYIRFADNDSAKKYCETVKSIETEILEGEKEKNYWDEIIEKRKIKFTQNQKKQRGRDKLLRKAEKELGKHIKFDVDVPYNEN